MFGAILGDFIGSRHEFPPLFSRDFDLFSAKCEFTDDTICTVAVADFLLHQDKTAENIEKSLLGWGMTYFPRGFGKGFLDWLQNPNRAPYGSLGNGCLMRASSIALLSSDTKLAEKKSELVTAITHNHPDSIKFTRVYVNGLLMILQEIAQNPQTDASTLKHKLLSFYYSNGLEIKPMESYYRSKFHVLTKPTFEIALSCLNESFSYEGAIRNVMYAGSDSDTTAAIVGSMAELVFKMDLDKMAEFLNYLKVCDVALMKVIIKSYRSSPFWNTLRGYNKYEEFFEKVENKINILELNAKKEDYEVTTTRKFPI